MHSCPGCGEACYCCGDIDDIDTGDEEAEDNCTHCMGEDWELEIADDDFDLGRCGECDAVVAQGDSHDPECSRA